MHAFTHARNNLRRPPANPPGPPPPSSAPAACAVPDKDYTPETMYEKNTRNRSQAYRASAAVCEAFAQLKLGDDCMSEFFAQWYNRQPGDQRSEFIEQNPKVRADVARHLASAQKALERTRTMWQETVIMKYRENFSLKQLRQLRRDLFKEWSEDGKKLNDRHDLVEGVKVRRLASIALSYQISRERQALLDDYSPEWFSMLEDYIMRGLNGEHLGVAFPVGDVIDRIVRLCFASNEFFSRWNYMQTEEMRKKGIDGLLLLGTGYDGAPLPGTEHGMTLGATTCLNLGAASYLCYTLMPYVLYLGKESDEAALNALRGFEEYLTADGGTVADGRVVEFTVKERPKGLGAPTDSTEEARRLARVNRTDRSSSGGTMTIRMLVKVVGRFDLKAKFLAAGGSSFTAEVAGGGRVPVSLALNNTSEIVFDWKGPQDFDPSAEFEREYSTGLEDGIERAVVYVLTDEQVMAQWEDSEKYADTELPGGGYPNEEQRKTYAYRRNHAFYRRDGVTAGTPPDRLAIQPWIDGLHAEINTAAWVLSHYFEYTIVLGDTNDLDTASDDSPAQLFIGALQTLQPFKKMASRFANSINPDRSIHDETETRPSGRHAVLLHLILPPIRQALLGVESVAPVETDSQKLERIVIEAVLIAERHLFSKLRASTIKKTEIEDIINTGRAIRRLLVATGHNITYNLFYTFGLLPFLLEFIEMEFEHEDKDVIYGVGFLVSTQVHERLNQWVKLKAKYTSRREGWPEELLGNITIASVIAFLHSNKYKLDDPSPPERRYYDDFDKEMAKEGRCQECRCCSCALDEWGGAADVPLLGAPAYLGSILQLRSPLCSNCVAVLNVITDCDHPGGDPAAGSWVAEVQQEQRQKAHADGVAMAFDAEADVRNWPEHVRATEGESDDEEKAGDEGEMAACMGECDEDARPTQDDEAAVAAAAAANLRRRMARTVRNRGDDF
mmetsp:Transcript_68356/g.189987  ORF Transcript_68356/g.189987 Transcript_68356/m.189987 type:complete len:955 (+) Transcript_68356:1935-4799(+)